jgi:hydrogenase maturation protease
MGDAGVVVLGLGNVLCSDDGLGVVAVRRIGARGRLSGDVRVLDGGTLGLSLLPYFETARAVVLVDAVALDAPPGTLVRLERAELGRGLERLSVHQVGVADLVEAADLMGWLPDDVVLLGLVPETTALGLDLSPAVADAMPALVAAVVDELHRLGIRAMARAS